MQFVKNFARTVLLHHFVLLVPNEQWQLGKLPKATARKKGSSPRLSSYDDKLGYGTRTRGILGEDDQTEYFDGPRYIMGSGGLNATEYSPSMRRVHSPPRLALEKPIMRITRSTKNSAKTGILL